MIPYRIDPTPTPDPPFTKPLRKPWSWNPSELTILNVCMVVTAIMALFGLFLFAVLVAAYLHDSATPQQARSTTYHITVPPGQCLYYAAASNTYLILPCAP